MKDTGDQPLPSVVFHVDDTLNGYLDVADGGNATDWKGEAQLSVWLPGCPDARFEIYPDVPVGYQPLSNSRPSAGDEEVDLIFEFGFSQNPNISTVTPPPLPPICTSFRLGYSNKYDITDIAVSPDGTVWVATFNDGVRRLSPGNSEWEYIKTENGLVHNEVRSITVLDDGSVWFGTEGGASHFSPNGWTSLSTAQGLISNSVYDIAVAPDGDLWFAMYGGVSHLDIQTGKWGNITSDTIFNTVKISPMGIPWVAPFLDNLAQVINSDTEKPNLSKGVDYESADKMEFAPDGTMWIAGYEGLGKYNPSTGVLEVYDSSSTNGVFVDSTNDIAVAQDGSVWVAAGTYTPVIYHFTPWFETTSASTWQKYDHRDGLPTLPSTSTNNDTVHAIAIAPSGDLWIATTEHATRCQFDN